MRLAWLGRVRYGRAWSIQEELRRRILDGQDLESALLLEHDPVVTLGRGAAPANVLVTDDELARRGIERVETSRGGDVTWHGPGQLVAYPVVVLRRGIVAHMREMAEAAAEVAAGFGVSAAFRRDRPGVWTPEGKLASVGIHVRRRVAIHGIALNVAVAADAFSPIVPCGLRETRMVSLADLARRPLPPIAEVASLLGDALARRLARPARWLSSEESRALLSLAASVE